MDDIISQAKFAVAQSKLIVIPTDTVYGIASRPDDPEAVRSILVAKGRTGVKPPPILVSGIDQLLQVAQADQCVLDVVDQFWPGALTLILPMRKDLGWDLGDYNCTVAVRMPDNTLALKILEQTGPLAVTSANLTDEAPALNVAEAKRYFGDKVAVYIDGGTSQIGVSSTILSMVDQIKILREGVITAKDLQSKVPLLRGKIID